MVDTWLRGFYLCPRKNGQNSSKVLARKPSCMQTCLVWNTESGGDIRIGQGMSWEVAVYPFGIYWPHLLELLWHSWQNNLHQREQPGCARTHATPGWSYTYLPQVSSLSVSTWSVRIEWFQNEHPWPKTGKVESVSSWLFDWRTCSPREFSVNAKKLANFRVRSFFPADVTYFYGM